MAQKGLGAPVAVTNFPEVTEALSALEVAVKNFPNPMPISGALTPTSFSEIVGSPSDAPWDGVSTDATIIALLKRLALNTDTQ